MVHGNFHETIPGAFHERGNEAVHPLEWQKGRDAFPFHCLQGAAGIADAVLREPAADEIRDAAGNALDERVLPLRAITANQISAA